jgi:hypothetical protein
MAGTQAQSGGSQIRIGSPAQRPESQLTADIEPRVAIYLLNDGRRGHDERNARARSS